jgi:hypothetical protein
MNLARARNVQYISLQRIFDDARYPIRAACLFLVLALVLAALNFEANASAKIIPEDYIHDPIFAIDYRPSEIHFPSAPNDIYKCTDLKEPRSILFLYGKVSRGNIRFYFVYGWLEAEMDDDKGTKYWEEEHDRGIIVVVSPDGCQDISAGYAWTTDKTYSQEAEKIGITDEIATALLYDAFDREVRAFGGKEKFLRRLSAAGVDESGLPEQIQNKLSVLRAAGENADEVSLLKWLDNADPERDARSALEKHDFRLRAVYGYALIVPGVDTSSYGQYEKKYGFNPIMGTSDVRRSAEHARLNKRAYDYALRYNRTILKNAPK